MSEKIKKLNQLSQMRIMEDEVRGCLQVPTMKDLKKMVVLSGFFDEEENRKAFRIARREALKTKSGKAAISADDHITQKMKG